MAENDAPAAVDAGSPASTGDVSSSPSSSPDTGASTDSRAIAAQLLGDTEAAAPASPAATPQPDPSAPAGATTDGDDDAAYQALLASGSMPVDRHKAVLTNARNKTRHEVESEYREKYGWVDHLKADRARVENALGLMQALDGPHREQALRTLAQAMGITVAPPPAAPAEPEGPPPPDVRLDDGSEFYSAKQLAKLTQWQQAQFDKRLDAIQQKYDPLVQRQVHLEMRQHADAQAGTTLAQCRAEWPGFPALEGDIKARMTASPSLSLEHAYIQAFAAKGLPALQQQHETDRASQLSRKAAASSAPPSAPRAVTPLQDRDRSTSDITREVAAAAGLM
jgi:hypothetical protein